MTSGIILINKPKGISSNTAVNIVKHAVGAKKCGHLGTLDLEGEGLLPVTVNSATKLFDYFLQKDKTYITIFVFGFETDTLDLSGKVIKEKETNVTLDDVKSAAHKLVGKQNQMPPLYSAKKVNGQVAYKSARNGQQIDLNPKEIEIYSIKVLREIEKNTFEFEISCSSGTYIRSVCRDMAQIMSTYGSMQCILRTRCGMFDLKDAFTLEDVKNGNYSIIPCDTLFDYDKIYLNETETQKLLNGQIIHAKVDGLFKVYGSEFLGIGECQKGCLKLKLRLI